MLDEKREAPLKWTHTTSSSSSSPFLLRVCLTVSSSPFVLCRWRASG